MMTDGINLVMGDDGVFREMPEPYKTINIATEEDWNALLDTVHRGNQTRWVSVEDRLPETNNQDDHMYDVLVYIPKREGCRQHGIYIGKRLFVKGSDGTNNFFGIKTQDCEWTVWGWGYMENPIVTHWMPLPETPKKEEEHP